MQKLQQQLSTQTPSPGAKHLSPGSSPDGRPRALLPRGHAFEPLPGGGATLPPLPPGVEEAHTQRLLSEALSALAAEQENVRALQDQLSAVRAASSGESARHVVVFVRAWLVR